MEWIRVKPFSEEEVVSIRSFLEERDIQTGKVSLHGLLQSCMYVCGVERGK